MNTPQWMNSSLECWPVKSMSKKSMHTSSDNKKSPSAPASLQIFINFTWVISLDISSHLPFINSKNFSLEKSNLRRIFLTFLFNNSIKSLKKVVRFLHLLDSLITSISDRELLLGTIVTSIEASSLKIVRYLQMSFYKIVLFWMDVKLSPIMVNMNSVNLKISVILWKSHPSRTI